MRSCKLPSGAAIPVFGIGTWRMGESARKRPQELDAVRYALELENQPWSEVIRASDEKPKTRRDYRHDLGRHSAMLALVACWLPADDDDSEHRRRT